MTRPRGFSASGLKLSGPPGTNSRATALLTACAATLVVAITLATATMILKARDRALGNSERELGNVALMLAPQVDRIFDTAERLQHSLLERFHARGALALTAEDFEHTLSGYDVHLMLRDKIVGLPQIGTFTLFNARGQMFNFSRFWPIPDINVADRDFFQALRSDAALKTFIGKPIQNRATGTWVIHIAHKVTGPNHEFLGVLSAAIELGALEQFFSTIALGPDSTIFLVHRDGELLARHPHAASFMGRLLVSAAELAPVFAAGGVADRRIGLDGQDRLIAARAVANYPVVVGASASVATVLAGWRREAVFLGGAGGLSVLLVMAFALLIVRKLRQNARQVQHTLELQKLQLDTALDHMFQGLCMFDASARLVVRNRRYLEMYRLSSERLVPGCTLLEVLYQRQAAGTFLGDPEAYAQELPGDIKQGRIATYLVETADGRLIQVINQPMRNGGWVSTHEDVTERRRAEQERDRDRRLLDLVVENVPTAIFLRDAQEKRYALVNRAAESIWEIPREEILGRTAAEIFPQQYARTIADRDDELLVSTSGLFYDEHEITTFAGNTRVVTSRLHLVQGPDETQQYVLGVIEDVTERRRADERIAYMARHSGLTDLPNRVLFRERLEHALKWRRRDEYVAVICLGLDHFKTVNDTLGHPVGDKVLKAVAGRLRGCVTETDGLAHLGGDEFAIILAGLAGPAEVTQFVKRVGEWVRSPYDLDDQHIVLTASFGIAVAADDGADPDQLLKDAGLALHRAKSDGRDAYRFFEAEMDASMKARRVLELDMRKAIANNELELHYQPLVDARRNRIIGCEALVRWRHPQRGMIPPANFIPIAEETGLIDALGTWALRQACADAASWPDGISVAVNLSPVQFRKPNLALTVTDALASSGLSPQRLELEVTESVLMQNNEATLATLHQLRDLGVRIAMDDFGTGYSSLSYLRSFPFNKIKIDQSFIADLSEKDEAVVIVQAITDLARNLDMKTTAEGVETERQRDLARAAGCTEMQGYLFSRPLPLNELWPLLEPARKAG
ncbi:MAG TPA: EAL domain-containing protein [Xanthobacteraceae bacterium]|nr:EAL domain-containing protein [Xanthobacteraceae bacterium]